MRIDRALGQALAIFRNKKFYNNELGFVRLSDYVREMLGISTRTVQEMIRTEQCLESLPETAIAWEMGLVQSEQVRLLCRIGEPGRERDWLFHAQRLSVRELAELIRSRKAIFKSESEALAAATTNLAAGNEPMKQQILAGEIPETGHCVTGGPSSSQGSSTRRDPCGPREAGTFDETTASLEAAGLDEKVSLDEDDSYERISFPAPLRTAVRWRMTLRMGKEISGQELPDWALAENLCADYLAGRPLPSEQEGGLEDDKFDDSSTLADHGDHPLRHGEPIDGSVTESKIKRRSSDADEPEAAADPDRSSDEPAVTEPSKGSPGPWLPRDLETFLEERPPEEARALSERIVRLGVLRTRVEALLSKRLYEFVQHEEPWRAGYKTVAGYAQEALGVCERRSRYLISLERRLFRAPLVREEYRRGGLSWLQCLLLLRVCRGETSESGWIEYAKQVPILRLREAVEEGELRAVREYPCLPPLIRDGNGACVDSHARAAIRQMSARSARDAFATTVAAAHRALSGRQMSARVPKVRISFSAPRDVAHFWHETIAEVQRVEGRPLQEWEAVERLLDAFIATWDDENARRIRREHKIIERDGWRCTVPICSSRRNLHVHHVIYRSRGGGDAEWNLTTLCIPHHQHAVHGAEAGRVKVIGRAPYRLRWELGRQEGGPPALVFEGERRLSVRAPSLLHGKTSMLVGASKAGPVKEKRSSRPAG